MPYIPREKRPFARIAPDDAGELNFRLYEAVLAYWRNHGPSYASIRDILAAFEGAKLEFYIRHARPYEDNAIARNGDVV